MLSLRIKMIKVYEYSKCSSCVKAIKFLESQKVKFQKIPIVETPPTLGELQTMLGHLKVKGETFKKLFNTSGIVYREEGISEKIKNGMSEADALKMLSKNGKLIKRPFLLGEEFGTVGFDEKEWKKLL
jgi:arsenate reductase (glutaredoxin)